MPNPLFQGWYADPELHRFQDRYYIYPTFSAEYELQTFFEVWSSPDLQHWQNEGKILEFADIPWSTNRAAWAPSVTEQHGTYYLFFSAGDGAGIGVATADSPKGPFKDALGHALIYEYHHGAQPIDAHFFRDDDGRAYLFYGGWSQSVVVELQDDLLAIKGEFIRITPEGYVEGPFMFKRSGEYYFLWSEGSWGDPSYAVAYARADSPRGPFHRKGKILQSDPQVATSPGHCSVLRLPTGVYTMAYHRRPLGDTNRHHRVVCLDALNFDESGDILPVQMT